MTEQKGSCSLSLQSQLLSDVASMMEPLRGGCFLFLIRFGDIWYLKRFEKDPIENKVRFVFWMDRKHPKCIWGKIPFPTEHRPNGAPKSFLFLNKKNYEEADQKMVGKVVAAAAEEKEEDAAEKLE